MSREQERSRLIQLIGEIKAFEHGGLATVTDAGIADYLLDNGIIVPPVKVGDKVYELEFGGYYERIVVGYHYTQEHPNWKNNDYICVIGKYCNPVRHINTARIGKTVFLTQEEAEKALKGLT